MRSRQGDKETGRQGDKETGRRGQALLVSLSPTLFFLLLFTLYIIAAPASEAQTGEITGRVVTEDGVGMPNVTVFLNPVATDRRPATGGSQNRTATDEDGNFKFTGLAPRVYS